MFLVSSEIGCWSSPSIGRVAGLGCDDVSLEGFGFEVHITLGKGLMCARVNLWGWAGLMRVCLWLRLLMLKVVCRLSRDLAVMSCARKMLCGVG
jgi:hypothetical protein